ncbi:phosphoribosylglycinamide formyltransferase [Clavibacter michiganensis]|uniref:phosphoribosylglycinamide formyltransferase n=1 Tax=Clavibacter michiganensis TaxID=28447 RepID=UPI0026DB7D27|nr:phosphoribosylglycinamide formyltransferase [Clavibacter michiganensis]MDO4024709.1 phosphoribosylglycinamide formyltransferase [Clavibacter michiganensis]MDO4034022.1 phosphoribosylglycinamide formyltransferase [Clavibacter michiganensis]MDO4045968.1 phosphoribosylglycinamide formyltransferase [Clavibacter michiganensis]MDO4074010.1 phosphoribosylglycinamide formyltransferase [Clavibacter michiganensis]MDO4105263.1 phosphoribosylglycinamide formyltransferase [Clavibacter michiganensis]
MLNVVVLISGSGTNLHALLEAADHARYPARVIAVGADRDADGLRFAEERGIPTFTVPFASFPDRASWGDELAAAIARWEPDLVVLSGFMRLLPPRAVAAFAPRIVNTHPAYLPEFPGAHAVRDAIAAGATSSGASIIVVDTGVDTGPVLAQERVPVEPDDTEHTLHERIKVVERRLLVDTVRAISLGTIDLKELSPA